MQLGSLEKNLISSPDGLFHDFLSYTMCYSGIDFLPISYILKYRTLSKTTPFKCKGKVELHSWLQYYLCNQLPGFLFTFADTNIFWPYEIKM